MKNYLVIGASSGIGKAIVEQLSNESNSIWATYNENPTEVSGVNYFQWNHENDLPTDLLPESLDGVVYCPGSIDLKPFGRIKPEDFVADFQLQVGGAIKVLQQTQKALKTGDEGSVVLFSTVAVQQGFNFHTKVAASKGAIEGLARSLAAEWAPKIRVNVIAPSLTDTPLASKLLSSDEKKAAHAERHPMKKIGKAEDIANLTNFLLDNKSSWITGQVISVDGGMSSIKM